MVGQGKWLRRGLGCLLTGALLAALTIQFLRRPAAPVGSERSGHLALQLPSALDGWRVMEEPLGATESIKARTAEILSFDDCVFRRYVSGSREFSVYAAHWSKGRMPTRLISIHTPDRCWIENGWSCTMAKFNEPVEGAALPPAQVRTFTPPGQSVAIHVWFWLSIDGESYDFGHRLNTIPSPIRWAWEMAKENFVTSGEQVFVRVTSTSPLNGFAGDPGFERVMAAVRDLLAQRLAK